MTKAFAIIICAALLSATFSYTLHLDVIQSAVLALLIGIGAGFIAAGTIR
jgi:hypothetical protein